MRKSSYWRSVGTSKPMLKNSWMRTPSLSCVITDLFFAKSNKIYTMFEAANRVPNNVFYVEGSGTLGRHDFHDLNTPARESIENEDAARREQEETLQRVPRIRQSLTQPQPQPSPQQWPPTPEPPMQASTHCRVSFASPSSDEALSC